MDEAQGGRGLSFRMHRRHRKCTAQDMELSISSTIEEARRQRQSDVTFMEASSRVHARGFIRALCVTSARAQAWSMEGRRVVTARNFVACTVKLYCALGTIALCTWNTRTSAVCVPVAWDLLLNTFPAHWATALIIELYLKAMRLRITKYLIPCIKN